MHSRSIGTRFKNKENKTTESEEIKVKTTLNGAATKDKKDKSTEELVDVLLEKYINLTKKDDKGKINNH